MVNLMARLGGRGRHNGANAIVHLAREVVGRRRTIQNATQEVRNAVILDSLADEDFRALDTTISERTTSDREFAQTLARLTFAAARAKGFDRCVVDAALRLDSLIPVDDPAHERDKLLRDAYNSAQKASYIRGGRLALGRLGRRAVEAGDLERARVLLHQQMDLGPEKDDTAAEVDSALVLGDILRRENDDDQAQAFYRRAGAAAERLEYRQGVAEALVRQIDTTPSANLETVAALQHQALDAAQRTGDQALEARILVGLADTLVQSGRLDDATPYFRSALAIAQETSDLALEARCVTALAHAHRELGHTLDAVEAERAALGIEERLGNRPAAANWALSLGMSELRLRNLESAVEAFERARLLANQIGDDAIEQRAEGSLGIASTVLGRGAEAIDHLGRAIDLARRAEDQTQEAQWVSSLGQAYWMFGQIDDAIRVTNDAISVAEATRDSTMQAESFALLGQIYAAQRDTIRARDCYTRALQLNRDLGQTSEQITTLTALATLAANSGQFTQASQLFDQALQLAQTSNDRSTTTVLHGRMGSLAQKRGDQRTALGQFQRAVESAQSLGDARLLSRSLQYLATAQDMMGDPQAISSYERAVTAADDASDIRGGITMRLNMGMLIGRLPEQGAAEDAIGWLSDAANYAMEAGAEYNELRHQAEDLIQELGGSANRAANAAGRSRSDVDDRSQRQDPDGDPRWQDDDQEPDHDQLRYDDDLDDRSGPPRSPWSASGRYTDDQRSQSDRYPDDDRYQSDDDLDDGDDGPEPYGRDPRGDRSIATAADAYDDEYESYNQGDRYREHDEANDRRPSRDQMPDRGSRRQHLERMGFDSEDHTFDDRASEFGDGRYDDRYRPVYESSGRSHPDQAPARQARFDDRYDVPEDDRYAHPDDPDDDGFRPRQDRYVAYEQPRGESDRSGSYDGDHDDYTSSRDDRFIDQEFAEEESYARDRARSNGRGQDELRAGRRSPDVVNGSSGGVYGSNRYNEDPERGYDVYREPGADHYPQQRSGRNERTGRRESGRRVSPSRSLDDEPSDPDSPAVSRRPFRLSSLLTRSGRDVDGKRGVLPGRIRGTTQGPTDPVMEYVDQRESADQPFG